MITPGPWNWRNGQLIRYNEGGGITPIGIGAGNTITNCEPTLADRALIEAAPELLERLRELTAMVNRQRDFNDDGDGGMISRCEAILAKVDGAS